MDDKDRLLERSQQLLDAISAADWATYQDICLPDLTCFEPEARGHLVKGMDFHRFYFEQGGHLGPHQSTIVSPHVRLLGQDAAIVSYVRLVQRSDTGEKLVTNECEETRVWVRVDGTWKHAHFHRSANA